MILKFSVEFFHVSNCDFLDPKIELGSNPRFLSLC